MTKLKNLLLVSKTVFTPYSLIIIVIVLAFVVVDIYDRLLLKTADKQFGETNISFSKLPQFQLSAMQKNELSNLYSAYLTTDIDDAETANQLIGLSPEEQLNQQGLLKQLYIGSNVIELKAVIERVDPNSNKLVKLVLLNVSDIKTLQGSVVSVYDEEEFQGYRLKIINNTRVELSAVSAENNGLSVTLVMYEPIKNEDNKKREG